MPLTRLIKDDKVYNQCNNDEYNNMRGIDEQVARKEKKGIER